MLHAFSPMFTRVRASGRSAGVCNGACRSYLFDEIEKAVQLTLLAIGTKVNFIHFQEVILHFVAVIEM
jgi:hypothetical protein